MHNKNIPTVKKINTAKGTRAAREAVYSWFEV
jgi:hypothetical protein